MVILFAIMSIIFIIIHVYISSFYKQFSNCMNDIQYIKTISISIAIVLISSIPMLFIHYTNEIPMLKNILISIFAVDAIYYFTHYITHSIPFIYNIMHSTHHTTISPMPLDNFNLDIFDSIIYAIVILYIPLLNSESYIYN